VFIVLVVPQHLQHLLQHIVPAGRDNNQQQAACVAIGLPFLIMIRCVDLASNIAGTEGEAAAGSNAGEASSPPALPALLQCLTPLRG
jgi:hypothetical protein